LRGFDDPGVVKHVVGAGQSDNEVRTKFFCPLSYVQEGLRGVRGRLPKIVDLDGLVRLGVDAACEDLDECFFRLGLCAEDPGVTDGENTKRVVVRLGNVRTFRDPSLRGLQDCGHLEAGLEHQEETKKANDDKTEQALSTELSPWSSRAVPASSASWAPDFTH